MPESTFNQREELFRSAFLLWSLIAGVVFGVYFLNNPGTDLWIAGQLKGTCSELTPMGWCDTMEISGLRYLFMAVFIGACILAAYGLVHSIRSSQRLTGLKQTKWLFLAVVLAAGPGFVANTIFKDNWGRARPRNVVEFGGPKTFSPPFVMAGQCKKNCSFISGEASSTFAVAFAGAFLLPRFRFALLLGGIAAGLLTGSIRMLQGAHFLSDVLFAGVMMAFVVSASHAAVFGLWHYISRRVDAAAPAPAPAHAVIT